MNTISKEKIKKLSKLKQKKYRECEGHVIVEGQRIIQQLIDDGVEIKELYLCSSVVDDYDSFTTAIPTERCYLLNERYLQQLSATPSPQKVFALVAAKRKEITSFNRLLFLDKVSDPTNVGAIFRTASACGIDGIILSAGSCEVFNPRVIRASVGKVFSLPFIFDDEFDISNFEGEVIIADMRGETSIFDFDIPESPYIVVIGSEATGVSKQTRKIATKSVYIPMKNQLESLNAAVSASIIIYNLTYSRR